MIKYNLVVIENKQRIPFLNLTEQEVYDQAYEDWRYDCDFKSEEMSIEDLQDYIPGGPKSEDDLPDIIYDERNYD